MPGFRRIYVAVAAVVSAATLWIAAPAQAHPGDLVPGFGNGGFATYRLDPDLPTAFQDVVPEPRDGRILAIGDGLVPAPGTRLGVTSQAVIARYDALTGKLDPSFGGGGTVTQPIASSDNPCSLNDNPCQERIAVLPDRSVVAALSDRGSDGFGDKRTRVYRYRADGTPDPSFAAGTSTTLPGFSVTALKVDAAGDTFLGGYDLTGRSVVARLRPDGTLDTSFGSGGIAVTGGKHYFLLGMALDRKGRAVTVGEGCPSGGCRGHEMAATRLTALGQPDTSFGYGGLKRIQFYANSSAGSSVAIDHRGRIVLGGDVYNRDRRRIDFAVARLRRGGHLDGSFSRDGMKVTSFGSPNGGGADFVPGGVSSLMADHGKLIAVGNVGRAFFSGKIAIVRYNANGDLDRQFGHRGKVVTPAPGSPGCIASTSAIPLPESRFAVAGFLYGCDEQEDGYEGLPHAGVVSDYSR